MARRRGRDGILRVATGAKGRVAAKFPSMMRRAPTPGV